MNVLIANISSLPKKKELREYKLWFAESTLDSVFACHTNESIARAFAAYRNIASDGGVQRIIALVSSDVQSIKSELFDNMTAIEYYDNVVHILWPNVETILIPVEDESKMMREQDEILKDLILQIQRGDHIYIDAAGGRRTDATLIQETAHILRHIGIDNPMSLYADIQTEPNNIRDTSAFSRLESLSVALSEFLTTGRADVLNDACATEHSDDEWAELLQSIRDFSDSIRIGDVDSLDKTIKSVQESLTKCENTIAEDVQAVVIKQFLPLFRDKVVGDGKGVDYLRIIKWCVDNKMIQQALTIIVEKLPKYLIGNEYFVPRNAIERLRIIDASAKDTMYHGNWESYAFFKELLDGQAENDPRIQELKALIKGDALQGDVSESVREAYKTLMGFNNQGVKYVGDDNAPGVKYLQEAIKKDAVRCSSFAGLCDKVANEPGPKMALLGISVEKKNTIRKKLDAIAYIQHNGAPTTFRYSEQLDWGMFRKVLYSYVYVKALRNQINHASSDENLNETEKAILQEHGVDCTSFNMSTILKNLNALVDAVQRSKMPSIKSDAVSPKEFWGQIGDEVSGVCTRAGYMQIEGLDYEVHLIVGHEVRKESLVGKNIQAKVESFKRGTKILCDVRYINPNPITIDLSNIFR